MTFVNVLQLKYVDMIPFRDFHIEIVIWVELDVTLALLLIYSSCYMYIL